MVASGFLGTSLFRDLTIVGVYFQKNANSHEGTSIRESFLGGVNHGTILADQTNVTECANLREGTIFQEFFVGGICLRDGKTLPDQTNFTEGTNFREGTNF